MWFRVCDQTRSSSRALLEQKAHHFNRGLDDFLIVWETAGDGDLFQIASSGGARDACVRVHSLASIESLLRAAQTSHGAGVEKRWRNLTISADAPAWVIDSMR